ncbi:hypothetical protein GGI11_000079 [Coemansia sp. RSA 2049]|nr:hypothetical protein H4217_000282 [Coemansia sp. RSA 1939]KAJ2525416.1 hypothetical protein GGI11_000079 [Coemansia sp. RSA 2049]KAJ2617854.1 hypothetical protein EV177_000340 [Coemansia sp. RSA 1804]KAJ2695510.1 hypothetical protein GGH99_000080 [Coemansia sp. RSA 1285]
MDTNNGNNNTSDANPAQEELDPTSDERMKLYLEQQKAEEAERARLTEEWTERLVGKRYIEPKEGEEAPAAAEAEAEAEAVLDEGSSFSNASLRKPYRVLKGERAVMTLDYCAARLNVRVDDEGRCTGVFFA